METSEGPDENGDFRKLSTRPEDAQRRGGGKGKIKEDMRESKQSPTG